MGSVHTATCECGFSSDVTVGGGRRTFLERSLFPFYCHQCGLIEVNVAKLSAKHIEATCPSCDSQRATQYGVRPVSEHDPIRDRKRFWQFWKKHEAIPMELALEWGGRKVAASGHLCPACKKMTLKFSHIPSLMFD